MCGVVLRYSEMPSTPSLLLACSLLGCQRVCSAWPIPWPGVVWCVSKTLYRDGKKSDAACDLS